MKLLLPGAGLRPCHAPTANCSRRQCVGGRSVPTHTKLHPYSNCCRQGPQSYALRGKQRSLAFGSVLGKNSDPCESGYDTEDETEDAPLEELSTARHIITVDGFEPKLVAELRGVFDERFADPRAIHARRFAWDVWWCPDALGTCQYYLVRTQVGNLQGQARNVAGVLWWLLEWGSGTTGRHP
jgi:hypothetical protein